MGSWGSFDIPAEHPGFLASYFFLKITKAPSHRHFSCILRLAPLIRNLTLFILSRSSSSKFSYLIYSRFNPMVFKIRKSFKTSRQKQSDKLRVLRHFVFIMGIMSSQIPDIQCDHMPGVVSNWNISPRA